MGANKVEIAAALNPHTEVALKDLGEEKNSLNEQSFGQCILLCTLC